MQNIMIPEEVGNDIAKFSYLEIIYDTAKKYHMIKSGVWIDDGYESDDDMVHIIMNGRESIVYAIFVNRKSLETGNFSLALNFKGENDLQYFDCNATTFDTDDLDRIAYEVYDYYNDRTNNPEYEEVRKEIVAGNMDNYREFMS